MTSKLERIKKMVENNSHARCYTPYGNPNSRLWQPLKVGNKTIKHRVGLAPLTRYRAPNHIPQAFVAEYYKQRASGGLLVTEATFIAKEAGGYPFAPGIYNQEQVEAWKAVTKAVHEKESVIYCQLWALGRANGGKEEGVEVVSASNIPVEEGAPIPRALTIEDIKRYMSHYKHAARNAIEAGFDGVEIHGAHGYLPDQFLQRSSNNRGDIYGGSLENRARFALEALESVTQEIGQERTAIRISPFSVFQGMGHEEDPFETFGYLVSEIKKRFPKLAYISVTDNRFGNASQDDKLLTCDKFRAILRGVDPKNVSKFTKDKAITLPDPSVEHPTVFFSAGGYSASEAEPHSDRTGDVVAFGRVFIANPDLPHRIRNGLELNPYDRSTFYTHDQAGYTDYPFANESTKKYAPALTPSL
ncbi:hypothetical protein HK103_003257 [Boothiomyces macroporosus]|uniref:NADH:flavin oxidoreductase/NADH oxidase N-terminal domain-containing protein n=1 Tax=Boothiomyces macroporosus TaxID=261099 RepID=A0AAD5UL81_9FUNG|nr:hypothetical protein HK103_003257 [Boothiomyces macroporosus]